MKITEIRLLSDEDLRVFAAVKKRLGIQTAKASRKYQAEAQWARKEIKRRKRAARVVV